MRAIELERVEKISVRSSKAGCFSVGLSLLKVNYPLPQ